MIQPKDELIRDAKISGIKKQVAECINAAFSKGYETCFEQKKEIEDRAYQKGLEDGKQVGYDKGYEDGAKCQDEVQYQKGLDDAWNMLKYICGGRERLLKVFGTISITKIITDYTASEAKAKIDAWEQKKKEARSGYVSFVGEKPQEQGVTTVFPDSPCDLCRFSPPSAYDGKPCTMCPAEGRSE